MSSKLPNQLYPRWLVDTYKYAERSATPEILGYSLSLALVSIFIGVLHEDVVSMLTMWHESGGARNEI